MTINAARYGLITNEFRYQEAYDSALDADYLKAREMEIDSNLDLSNISTLLTDLFAVIGSVRRRFLVIIKGTDYIGVDDFATGCPPRLFTAPELGLDQHPVIVTRAQIKHSENRTYLELWG